MLHKFNTWNQLKMVFQSVKQGQAVNSSEFLSLPTTVDQFSSLAKGNNRDWTGEVSICSRMLYHWAIPPCIQQGGDVSIFNTWGLTTGQTCREKTILYLLIYDSLVFLVNFVKAIEYLFAASITSTKHEEVPYVFEKWRQLCKPQTQWKVCPTLENFPRSPSLPSI